MQVSQADPSCSKRVGVAEHLIKFRSSPNLKNMKKFIRSKMGHIEVTNGSASDPSPPPPNTRKSEADDSEVQPPLPLEPPPPDETFSLQVKEEMEDSKYESSPSEEIDEVNENREIINGVNNSHQELPEKPKVTICRDYIRGSCKRPGTCKYAHKYDVTQLVGVYKFCREYQTSVCTYYPNCKYVHASVFEEQHFYRTGILPPHALAHHKKVNVMQPLLPPPPPPPPQELQTNLTLNTNMSMNHQISYTNPPPPLQNEMGVLPHSMAHHKKLNGIQTLPPPPPPPPQEVQTNLTLNANMSMNHQYTNPPPPLQNEICQVDATLTKASKRTLIEQFGSSPSDRDTYEPYPKKCKHCDIMDFRLQYHKDETEKMVRAKDQKTENTCALENKKKKINTLILALFKLPSNNQRLINDSEPSLGGDKDKMLLEHLSSVFTVNNMMTTLGEDE